MSQISEVSELLLSIPLAILFKAFWRPSCFLVSEVTLVYMAVGQNLRCFLLSDYHPVLVLFKGLSGVLLDPARLLGLNRVNISKALRFL